MKGEIKVKKLWKAWFEKSGLKKRAAEKLGKFNPMETPDILVDAFLKKWLRQLLIILAVIFLAIILFSISNQEEGGLKEGNILLRPDYNEAEQEVNIWAGVGSKENAEDIKLLITPEKYTFEEFESLVEEAIPELEKEILGNNLSLEAVTENLLLPEILENTPVEILWQSDKEELITREGTVNQEKAGEEGEAVVLTAVFTYEDYKISHSIGVFVEPEILSEQMQLHKKLLAKIEETFIRSENDRQVQLPGEIEGKKVFYGEEKQESIGIIVLFFLMGIVVWIISIKEEIEKKEKEREEQLLTDYPELISQFTLLLSSGMTVSGVWKRLVNQYEKHQRDDGKKRRYVYEEMTITWWEIQNGLSEVEAINHFGNRIKLVPYLKFASLLSQNLRKGSKGLIGLLKTEAKLAQEERKEMAKQLGEEAGTKLLLPMLMMFGIVLVMILVPAFMSF